MKDKQDMEGLWKSSRRYIFIVAFGVILYEIIENLTAVKSSVGGFFDAISPIFIAMAISFIANMPMCFLENRLFSKWRASKLKRVICVVMAMLFVLSIITVLIVIVGPKLVDSIKSLAENYDSYSKSLIKWGTDVWERLNLNDDIAVKVRQVSEDILDKLDGFISGLASGLLRFTVSTVGVVVDMLFALIISIYALANKENLLCQCRKFIKAVFNEQHASRILDVCARTNKSLHNYVYGMLIECFILGMMCFMGMQILGFPLQC